MPGLITPPAVVKFTVTLDTAAESDTATGGVDRNAKIFPLIKIVSRQGITTLPEKRIAALFKRSVA